MAAAQHSKLIDALEAHDLEKAKNIASEHIKSQSEAIIEVIKK